MKHPIILSITLIIAANIAKGQAEKINHVISGNTETWTINNPIVYQHQTDYHQIVFKNFDDIYVTADGCVQTGGSGSTWKKYVTPLDSHCNPETGNYFGLINIPHITPGLVRISNYLDKKLSINLPQELQASNMFLSLGYLDDDYSDNGYYDRNDDNGTCNQCNKLGNAYVQIKIIHHNAAQSPDTTGNTINPKDFDIISFGYDINGFPIKPVWGKQFKYHQIPNILSCSPWNSSEFDVYFLWWKLYSEVNYKFPQFNPGCTDFRFYENDAHVCGPHLNFLPIYYEGVVEWGGHSNSFYDDDDYYMAVNRNDNQLYSTARTGVHIEFNSEETVDNWDNTGTWWDYFHHQCVDNGDDKASNFINDDSVYVVGLLTIDPQHDPHIEMNPVFAMFVKDNFTYGRTPAFPQQATTNRTVYHFFVRNFGSEGFCGDNEEFLGLQDIQIRIPNAKISPAPLVNIKKGAEPNVNGSNVTYPDVTPMSFSMQPLLDGSCLLTFHLLEPGEKSWFVGDISFETNVPDQSSSTTTFAKKRLPVQDPEEQGAIIVNQKINSLPIVKKNQLMEELNKLHKKSAVAKNCLPVINNTPDRTKRIFDVRQPFKMTQSKIPKVSIRDVQRIQIREKQDSILKKYISQ
jgi:hypothetical protein